MLSLFLDHLLVIVFAAVVAAGVLVVSMIRRTHEEKFSLTSLVGLVMKMLGLTALGAVALLAMLGWFGLFDPRSPLPPEALEQLKAFVENDGRQARAADTFSMPGGVGPTPATGDTVKVTHLKYLYPIPTHEAHGSIPAASTVQYYRIEDSRLSPGSSPRSEDRFFYVYQDAAGAWRFLENQMPAYAGTETSAVAAPIPEATPVSTAAPTAMPGEMIPPTPTHYFNDYASSTTPKFADALNLRLEAFEHATTDQFIVVILPKMQSSADPGDYCRRVFNAWGVGQKGVNNGVVLFVFLDDHKVQFSVGRGLEGSLSNTASQKIIDQMMPFFRKGDFEGGLSNAVDNVINTLRAPARAAHFSP